MDDAETATPRVLFVCGADFRSPTEKVVLGYALGLQQQGHAVAIAMRGDPATAEAELGGGLPAGIEIFPYRFRGPRVDAAARAGAARFAPDVVHLFNPRYDLVAAVRGLRPAGTPLVVHFEDDEWGLAAGDRSAPLHRRLARAAGRRLAFAHPPLWRLATPGTLAWAGEEAAGLEAITPELAAHVTARTGRPCEVLLPVHPGLAAEAADVADPPLPAAVAGRDTVVFTGAVFAAHLPDFRLLLDAVGELKRRGTDAALVTAGAVAPRFDLREYAREAGLGEDDFFPLGYLEAAEMRGLLRDATVLVQPGKPTEFNRLRLPSKLQAYLASGTPTVTFSCGAGELLEDRCEVVKTVTGEPAELADRIGEVLADTALREALAANGPAAAERLFGLRRNTETLVGIYRAALGAATDSAASAGR
jgi:glycosyltransferase involved in cell wall biosynthesis